MRRAVVLVAVSLVLIGAVASLFVPRTYSAPLRAPHSGSPKQRNVPIVISSRSWGISRGRATNKSLQHNATRAQHFFRRILSDSRRWVNASCCGPPFTDIDYTTVYSHAARCRSGGEFSCVDGPVDRSKHSVEGVGGARSTFNNTLSELDRVYHNRSAEDPIYVVRARRSKSPTSRSPAAAIIYLCPRRWLYQDLAVYIRDPSRRRGLIAKTRKKNGELRLFEAVIQSLYPLGCELRLSSNCSVAHMDTYIADRNPPDEALRKALHREAALRRAAGHYFPSLQHHHSYADVNKTARGRSPFFLFESWGQEVLQDNQKGLSTTAYYDYCKHQLQRTYFTWGWLVDSKQRIPPALQLTPHGTLKHTTPIGLISECPFVGAPKEHYAVLWGKRKQLAGLQPLIDELERHIPIVSMCQEKCGIVTKYHAPLLTAMEFRLLMAKAKFVIGLLTPRNGPTALEAAACGTPVICVKKEQSLPELLRNNPLLHNMGTKRDAVRRALELLSNPSSLANIPAATDKYLATLPDYYTRRGHQRNLQRIFGVDDQCRPVQSNLLAPPAVVHDSCLLSGNAPRVG